MPDPVAEVDPLEGKEISFEDYSKYRESGELPTAKEEAKEVKRDEHGRFAPTSLEPKVQESAPADAPKVEKAEAAKADETVSDPAPEKEAQEIEEVGGKEAQKRIRELVAKVKRLEALTDAKTDVKVEPSTTTKSDVIAESSPAPKKQRPNLATFAGSAEEFDKAAEEYDAQLREDLRNEVRQQLRNEQVNQEIESAEKETPGFKERLDFVTKELVARKECAPVTQILGSGPEWKQIVNYLGEHPEEAAKLVHLSTTSSIEAVIEAVHVRDRALKPKETAAPAHEVKPAPKAADKFVPPDPVGARQTAKAFDVNDESTDADTWAKKRYEQLTKRS